MSQQTNQAYHQTTLIIAISACILVFVGLFFVLKSSSDGAATHTHTATPGKLEIPVPSGMEWPELIPAHETIQKERAAQRAQAAQGITSHDKIQDFYRAVRAVNDHQFKTHPIPSKTPESLDHDFNLTLGLVLEEVKPEDMLSIAPPIVESCDKGLEQLQQDIKAGKTTLQKAMEDADFETYQLYRKNCGNMLSQLHQRKMINEDGSWRSTDDKMLASILQRYRWAYLVHLYVNPLELLTESERQAFLRWRVEDKDAFSMEQRKKYLEDIYKYIPEYPKGMAEAMFAYEQGNTARAAEILSLYKNKYPEQKTYTIMYNALSKELAE